MKLSVAANWDKALLANLKGLPVHSVFAKLGSDVLGGGRASYLLPEPTREEVRAYVREARRRKIKFNYLLNPVCTGNREYVASSRREIDKYLEWVAGLGVDYVTVAAPWLLQALKRNYPGLKVVVSALANVNNLQIARFYEDLGADSIVLPEHVNRDFKFLGALRKSVKCDIQLIANMTCLYGCPFQLYHANVISHSSCSGEGAEKFHLDYCVMNCTRARLLRAEEIIKSRWIRPEDLHVYEELGLDHFKLIERYDTTATLTKTARAYAARKYSGNLLDILNAKTDPGRQFPVHLKCLRGMNYAQALKLWELRGALYLKEQYLDNGALDGFLDFFRRTDCRVTDCGKCGYCKKTAKRAFRLDPAAAKRNLSKLDGKLDDFIAGGKPARRAAKPGRAGGRP
ncbi:MAG TPA: peptidase U32 [Elusimicrobia bacterium]|nr:MAG: hypothetical protein A2016_04190 [Elusimicrobia bacterium GWF2_62_30]HBA59606.1 peptidase U32 [Elusimicrobiota bacterium]